MPSCAAGLESHLYTGYKNLTLLTAGLRGYITLTEPRGPGWLRLAAMVTYNGIGSSCPATDAR